MADRCSAGEVDGERKGAMEMVGIAWDAAGGEVEPILLQEFGTSSVETYFRRRLRSGAHESPYPLLLCGQKGTVDSKEFKAVGGEPYVQPHPFPPYST